MAKKIIGILLVFSSLLFLGCSKKTTQSSTSAPTLEIATTDSNQAMETVKTNLLKAKEAAKTWSGNAQFTALVLKISPSSKANTLTETFVFGSPSDPSNWWTYSISEGANKIVRSLTPKEDFLGTDFQPIDEKYLAISYLDALKTAESSGGEAFRAQNNNISQINVVLRQSSPKNWLWWQVEYQANDLNLKVLVSAADGKVYNDKGELFQ